MKLRVMLVVATITLCTLMVGQPVGAKVSPAEQIMVKRLESHLDVGGRSRDATYLRDVYEDLQSRMASADHPYVRSQLRQMSQWLESNYAFNKERVLVSKDRFIRANGEIVERGGTSVTLAHEELIAKYGEHASAPMVATTTLVPHQSEEKVSSKTTTTNGERYTLKNNSRINVTLLRTSWLRWVNDFREEEGVQSEIVHQPLLDKTATEWSYKMRSDGTWSHKRTPESSFYDYDEIDQWFKDRGLAFSNVNRATHTENVGQSSLHCRGSDCTDEAKESLYRVFEYFINEKGQDYDAHYKTVVQPYFREMGFGIAVDEETGILYSTMHYATEAKRAPGRISSR